MRLALLLVFLGLSAASAQIPTMVPGARVRIDRPPGKKVEGVLMSQTADSLSIVVGAFRTSVASQSITRIRAHEGKSHGAGAIKGMKMGGGIGLGLGALALLVFAADGEPDAVAIGAIVGAAYGLIGAILGATVGGAMGAEKWTTVYSRAPP